MPSSIGVKINAMMSAGSTVAKQKKAPQAALNLCIYPYDRGKKVAKEMHKK